MKARKKLFVLVCLCIPATLFAFSSGPPIKRTGAAVDGGLNCTACHRSFAVNSGAGKVTIDAPNYYPGRVHTIRVKVEDPQAMRWGFQLTARLVSDQTKEAGVFLATEEIRVRCDPTGDAPVGSPAGCNGALEFIEHTRPATMPGTTGSRTFEVSWVAPGRNLGDVIFYAAGNAANNDGTNNGDYIYTTSKQVSAENCEDRNVLPTISGVSDAASGRALISSNSMISIYGTGFASADDKYKVQRGDLSDGKVATELACAAVEVDGKLAPVFYVQSNQINAQAPFLLGSGPVSVRVILNPSDDNPARRVASAMFQVNQQQYSPALFTFDGKSAAALNASTNYSIVADPSVVSGGAPAKPDDVLVLYGTGFGLTDPVYQPGEFANDKAFVSADLKVTIGGVTLSKDDVLYAGLSFDAPGLYQFNIKLPSAAPDGNVPVTLSIGGVETQKNCTFPVKR